MEYYSYLKMGESWLQHRWALRKDIILNEMSVPKRHTLYASINTSSQTLRNRKWVGGYRAWAAPFGGAEFQVRRMDRFQRSVLQQGAQS